MAVYYTEHTRNKLTGTSRKIRKWPDAQASIDEVINHVSNGATSSGTQFQHKLQGGKTIWQSSDKRPILKTLYDRVPEQVDGVDYPHVVVGDRKGNTVRFDVVLRPHHSSPTHIEHFITFFETVELV